MCAVPTAGSINMNEMLSSCDHVCRSFIASLARLPAQSKTLNSTATSQTGEGWITAHAFVSPGPTFLLQRERERESRKDKDGTACSPSLSEGDDILVFLAHILRQMMPGGGPVGQGSIGSVLEIGTSCHEMSVPYLFTDDCFFLNHPHSIPVHRSRCNYRCHCCKSRTWFKSNKDVMFRSLSPLKQSFACASWCRITSS